MPKFRKKPVVIEAFQFTEESILNSSPKDKRLPQWVLDSAIIHVTDKIHNSHYAEVKTLEGVMIAKPNDWFIKGVNSEVYPCKPDIFEKTYEPAGNTWYCDASHAPDGSQNHPSCNEQCKECAIHESNLLKLSGNVPVEEKDLRTALKEIAQFSDVGSHELAVVQMKAIASDALKSLPVSPPVSDKEGEDITEEWIREQMDNDLEIYFADAESHGEIAGTWDAAQAIMQRILPLKKELEELKRMEKVNYSLMLSGEQRGHDKAKEHYQSELTTAKARIAELEKVPISEGEYITETEWTNLVWENWSSGDSPLSRSRNVAQAIMERIRPLQKSIEHWRHSNQVKYDELTEAKARIADLERELEVKDQQIKNLSDEGLRVTQDLIQAKKELEK